MLLEDDISLVILHDVVAVKTITIGVEVVFAFRTRKKELSCEELAMGRREADSVPKTLKGAKDLSPAQISRTNMLAAEVGKELAAEMRSRRCKA